MKVRVALALIGCLIVSACGSLVDEGSRELTAGAGVATDDAALEAGDATGAASGAGDGGGDAVAGATSGDTAGGTDGGGGPVGGGGASGPAAAKVDCTKAGNSDTGVSATSIILGVDATLSGPLATLGEEQVGALNAYIQMVNAAGGINCRKVAVKTYDNRFDANQSAANIQRLVQQDKAFAVVTFTGDESMDFVTRQKVPTLTFGVTAYSFSSRFPTAVPVVGNALLWQHDLVYLVKNTFGANPKNVAIIYDNQTWDMQPYLDGFKKSWEKIGAKVVTTDAWTLSSGDCTSLVLKWQQLNVDFVDVDTAGFPTCISAAERQQWKPAQGWGGWPASTVLALELAGAGAKWADGIIGGSLSDRPDGRPGSRGAKYEGTLTDPLFRGVYPELKEYLDAIVRYSPKLNNPDRLESPVVTGFWIVGKLFTQAARSCGLDLTRECFLEHIHGLRNWDTGIAPPIRSFAQDCKTGSEYVWAARWHLENGRWNRNPETKWATSPWKEDLGGDCFLTKLADAYVG